MVRFDALFEQMLLVSKGETTTKEAIKTLKAEWGLSKKEFESLFYGGFPPWFHEYVVRSWSEWVGYTLDGQFLSMVVRQNITNWDDVFCSDTSFSLMFGGMESIYAYEQCLQRTDGIKAELKKQISTLEHKELVASIKLDILTELCNKNKT